MYEQPPLANSSLRISNACMICITDSLHESPALLLCCKGSGQQPPDAHLLHLVHGTSDGDVDLAKMGILETSMRDQVDECTFLTQSIHIKPGCCWGEPAS